MGLINWKGVGLALLGYFISAHAGLAQLEIPVWTKDIRFGNAKGVVVDHSGHIIMIGDDSGAYAFRTVKLSPEDGSVVWGQRPAIALGTSTPGILTLDSHGNVVVTGKINPDFWPLCYVAKYAAADGALLWEKYYPSPENRGEAGVGILVDSADNVVVLSNSGFFATGKDIHTCKFSGQDGSLLWERRASSSGQRDDIPQAVAKDAADNIIITARLFEDFKGEQFYTAKYAALDGALVWERIYDQTALPSGNDQVYALAVDPAGNAIVTGASRSFTGIGDIYTAKYAAADGALLWEKLYNGTGNDDDRPNAVATDDIGDVYVSGASQGAGTGEDFYVVKYAAANGAVLWEQRYNGVSNQFDSAHGITFDPTGNVIVAGRSWNVNGLYDIYVTKYRRSDGAILWEHRNGALGDQEVISEQNAIASTPDGGFVICGQRNSNWLGLRYSPKPFYRWKRDHLGNAAAPALDDPDQDGASNLTEYGTNSLPEAPGGSILESHVATYAEGQRLRIFVDRDPAHDDVTIEVQASSQVSGPWSTIAATVNGRPFTGPGYFDGETLGVGLKRVEIRDTVNTSDAFSRFMRVRVSR